MPDLNGQFVWYDLMTTDVASAKDFYTKAIGWGTQAWEGPMPYTMWTANGTPIGGTVGISDEQAAQGIPPHWMAYVRVADVDAAAAKARSLGGNVLVEPADIPDMGRYAVVSDPQSASIGLYQSADESAGGEPGIGHFSWHELATSDPGAAFEFYTAMFGWEKTDQFDMGPMGVYQMYGQGGRPYGGMMKMPPDTPGGAAWTYYVIVDDIDAAVGRIKDLGGEVINGPMEVPGESGDRVANCIDPQGAFFAVHQLGAGSAQ